MTTRYIFLTFYSFLRSVSKEMHNYSELIFLIGAPGVATLTTINSVKYLGTSCKDTDLASRIWRPFEAISESVEACLYTIFPGVIFLFLKTH